MNSFRKLLGIVAAAVMLAAFALPASADDDKPRTKSISLSVTNQPLSTSTTLVNAVITNTGNSNANSFEIDWTPASSFVVSGATATSPNGVVTTGTCVPGRCIFTYQVPTKTTTTIKLTGAFANRCTPQSLNWIAYAWTGGPGTPSTSFTPGTATTPVAASCTFTFSTPPKDAVLGSKITGRPYDPAGPSVGVTLLQNGVAAPRTSVSLSATGGCATADPAMTTDGVATFTTLTAAVANPLCQLTASASGYSGPPSPQFQVVLPGTINFTTPPANTFIGSPIKGSPFNSAGDPVTVQLTRGGAPAPTGTSVRVSGESCAIAAATAVTDASGFARFSTLTTGASTTQTDCQLKASSLGFNDGVSLPLFDVVQPGQLGCDPGNNTFGTTGDALVVNGTRLGNVDDPSPTAVGNPTGCEVVPYVVSATCPDGVTGTACTNFIYDPLDQGTHMAFHFTWEWPIETIPEGGIDAIPETLQLFINGDPMPVELNLCPGSVAVYEGGVFLELTADPLYGGDFPFPQDQDLVAPGTQAGCLIGRNVIQDGSGLKLIEDAWVQGDYTAIRR